MHEMSIARNILEAVTEIARENGAQKVKKIFVTIGEWRAVVPESLRFCFEAIIPGTALENSELIIENIPIKAVCSVCGKIFHPEPLLFICPDCESREVNITGGQELQITQLEVD